MTVCASARVARNAKTFLKGQSGHDVEDRSLDPSELRHHRRERFSAGEKEEGGDDEASRRGLIAPLFPSPIRIGLADFGSERVAERGRTTQAARVRGFPSN